MGVAEYEPRLINQMLEFTYRYVTDVLDDAKVYSNHANKKIIDVDDVKLAVQCRMDHSFTSPPPRDLLMEIARHKNNQQLPLIKPYTGPRLPPDRYCLSSTNYKLASSRKKAHRIQIGLPLSQLSGGQRISLAQVQNKPSGGSGTQGINLISKGVPIPTVALMNKPAPTPVLQSPIVRVQTGLLKAPGGGVPGGFPASQVNLASQSLESLVSSPLKRKHEDDDYDQL
ncbi:hypothetical protein CHS0354_024247 [Potamilus streckersoni]|uniref:Transcription initiation factor TFIID subunit 9 n=1 Tax=Potamilus streckersoni TaxID=2493646 RepID=A0AAE0S776_9BIVA|nr:hypothetical protein CHS0354_024247 [Potamilus streckersoni]